jgi:hypothetical protein
MGHRIRSEMRRFPPPQRDLARERTIAAAESMQTIKKAQHDVIGKMHGVVPAMPKVACARAINVTEQRDRRSLPAALVC